MQTILILTVAAVVALIIAGVQVHRTRQLLIDPVYGCLSRQGLERRWNGRGMLIFFDIDRMKELNTTYGYSGVNARIQAALVTACRPGDAYAARWQSGDELVLVIQRAELVHYVLPRLLRSLEAEGLAAHCASVPALPSLTATVETAAAFVLAEKARRDRRAAAAPVSRTQ